jgi:hypothetical protein
MGLGSCIVPIFSCSALATRLGRQFFSISRPANPNFTAVQYNPVLFRILRGSLSCLDSLTNGNSLKFEQKYTLLCVSSFAFSLYWDILQIHHPKFTFIGTVDRSTKYSKDYCLQVLARIYSLLLPHAPIMPTTRVVPILVT